jgi:hypothetical protein
MSFMSKYKPLSLEELNQNIRAFDALFRITYTKQGKSVSNIRANSLIIAEIENRVHQRAAYYSFFHGFDINEVKGAALRSYWILKYRPFSHRIELPPDKEEDENVFFSFWSLVYTISGYIKLRHESLHADKNKFKEIKFPQPLIKPAFHTFRECDVSKESMMEYAEKLFALLICYNK